MYAQLYHQRGHLLYHYGLEDSFQQVTITKLDDYHGMFGDKQYILV